MEVRKMTREQIAEDDNKAAPHWLGRGIRETIELSKCDLVTKSFDEDGMPVLTFIDALPKGECVIISYDMFAGIIEIETPPLAIGQQND
jgi:hypothetical protein